MEQCLAQEAKIFNFFFKGMHRVQEFLLLFFVFFFFGFFFRNPDHSIWSNVQRGTTEKCLKMGMHKVPKFFLFVFLSGSRSPYMDQR